MELGTYRLAEINKGGGLRQKAVGLATQYLNGIGEWVAMPTSMTPTAHTHLYAGSAEAGGAATTATKLATTRALTIGNTAKNFDGSAAVSWTLAEIGANQWRDGVGTGAIMTNSATAAGLRSSDESKPYVYWNALSGQDLKAGGLAGTDQKWMLISPSTVATYAYGGEEYTYNNATANYVFLLLVDNADFIGSATNPFNKCRIIANAGTNYLSSYRAILTVGSPITGNVYPVIVTTGSSSAPSGINYTESVSLYAPLKSSSTNYTGNYSVASGAYSVASGYYSVASGTQSVASGLCSVASGDTSVASGNVSLASGYASVASGQYSVASGTASVASGRSSVALGERTIAGGDYQTVIGKWNLANTTDAFIIGNGTSTSARSNCMTVDFSGNMTLAGSISIGVSGDLTISKNAGLDRLAYFDSAGKLQSSASYTLSSFASASHNHDSTYLKLSGGTVTGTITLGSTAGIYKSGWDGNRIAYFVSGDLTTSADFTLSSFALAGHNHDATYSSIEHNHSGTYALADHTHSGYAAADHTHLYAGSSSAGGAASSADALNGLLSYTNYRDFWDVFNWGLGQAATATMETCSDMSASEPVWVSATLDKRPFFEGKYFDISENTGRRYTFGRVYDGGKIIQVYSGSSGSIAGTVVLIERSSDGSTWVTVGSGTVSSTDNPIVGTIPSYQYARVTLSSSSSTTYCRTTCIKGCVFRSMDLSMNSLPFSVSYLDLSLIPISNGVSDLGSSSYRWNNVYGVGGNFSGSLSVTGSITAGSFSGVGSSITSLNASNLSSGTVPIGRLPVGTESTQVSAGDHTHSGYAASTHNHDSAYSAIGHDHSGTYALASHTHSGYATSTHNHDATYLKLSGGTVTGKITLDTNGGIYKSGWDGNRIAYFVSGDLTTSSEYTTSSFALEGHSHSGYAVSTHSHSIPDLYCGVANIVPGRILISGSGTWSNPTWLDAGTNGKILGWTSGAPAWVDAPSGSSVTAANPTASVGLTAVNGSATTFMRSDAAPKLDVSIEPTWTGNHTFSGLTQFANVGIGVSPSTAYKLYVVEDKQITTEGNYIGNYLIAKYNTTLSSGTRQGIALLGQLWATGGTLTHAKGLDFKVYVPSGTVTEATAINAVIQTDGGSIGTAYALKLSRSGTAPTVKNYGIYQEDSAATNVFNGYCEFNGGTNLSTTGRVRNFLQLSVGTTLTPAAGTDLFILFDTSSTTTQTLILPTTNMASRAGDIIRVNYSGSGHIAFSTGSGNDLIKPAYSGADETDYLTSEYTNVDCVLVCDGTYWRYYVLFCAYN